MKKLLFIIPLGLSITAMSCSSKAEETNNTVQQEKETISKDVNVTEFAKLVGEGKGQVLDVRTPEEVKNGAIETAMFADFYADTFLVDAIKQLDKNKPVYLYCRSGNRSGKASKILQEKGYKVINVSGGYSQWNK